MFDTGPTRWSKTGPRGRSPILGPGPAPGANPPPSAPVGPGQPFAPSTTNPPGRGAAQSC